MVRLTTTPSESLDVETHIAKAWGNLRTVVAEDGEWELEEATLQRSSRYGCHTVKGSVTFARTGAQS